jgi:hypothetical protein
LKLPDDMNTSFVDRLSGLSTEGPSLMAAMTDFEFSPHPGIKLPFDARAALIAFLRTQSLDFSLNLGPNVFNDGLSGDPKTSLMEAPLLSVAYTTDTVTVTRNKPTATVVFNHDTNQSMPKPTSMVLFGGALLFVALIGRRKLKS